MVSAKEMGPGLKQYLTRHLNAPSLINVLHDCRVWWAKISWVSYLGEACYPAIQLMVNDGDATIRMTLRVHASSPILAMGKSRHATIKADGIGQRVGVLR